MDRCILRNDQTAGQVLVEKRELTVKHVQYFQQLDSTHSTYQQITNPKPTLTVNVEKNTHTWTRSLIRREI